MNKICKKKKLCENIYMYKVKAPLIAQSAKAGQFIIFRTSESGERIPLTIADTDSKSGLVTIIFQVVGKTTMDLSLLEEGDYIKDFVGPLGKPTDYCGMKKVCIIGGGVGSAIAFSQAKYLHSNGYDVDAILGFRNKDLIILKSEMKKCCNNLHICTDDGSFGYHGFVTGMLNSLIENGIEYDSVIAIGPLQMMKAVCEVTKKYEINTIVSMNSIMLDGTGMCGACRLTVGGKLKFACVDGPDFDGHEVDFDEAIRRNGMYKEEEKNSFSAHTCRLLGGNMNE